MTDTFTFSKSTICTGDMGKKYFNTISLLFLKYDFWVFYTALAKRTTVVFIIWRFIT